MDAPEPATAVPGFGFAIGSVNLIACLPLAVTWR